MVQSQHLWHDIKSNESDEVFNVVVEIPKGSTDKYELDKKTGLLTVDRQVSIEYPHAYGFIPQTLSEDGDPLDMFYFGQDNLKTGDTKEVLIFGGIDMLDNGQRDFKVLAMDLDQRNTVYTSPLSSVLSFLTRYKPPGKIKILKIATKKETIEEIQNSKLAYNVRFDSVNTVSKSIFESNS